MSNPQVFILDDNEEFRSSTAFLLEAMGYDVQHFGDHQPLFESLSQVPKEQSACLLLDIRMPEISGLDVHDLLAEQGIDLPVVYMTAHGDVPLAVTAMKKGALTFLEKPLDDEELEAALNHALSDVVQSRRISPEEREAVAAARERLASLTSRERQIADAITNNFSNKQIAEQFNISVKTVELHRSRALHKMQAKNAAHLVKLMMACEQEQANP